MGDVSSRIAKLSPEQRALLERRLGAVGGGARARPPAEPIAIVGMGCRFPGGVASPDDYWRLLEGGVDAVSEVPRDRWDVDSLYDPDPEAAGMVCTRWGGFLARLEEFDAAFFGISPREAARMDPQQRLVLEVAWEALEDAGQPVERLAGRAAGVFVGAHSLSNDYFLRQAASLRDVDVYTSTGVAHSIMANRLSYLLDLRGPSLAVDTACSSSLVAVHLACQSLRLGECELALAGGVNLTLSPETTIAFSKLNMMAADGRCKTFDARADGFVRGEGCGIVVLRRLADAMAEGDPVVAVIRGTATNQDGATNGITAPSGLAQQAVVRRALENGGVAGGSISYVETHGTGTALGDPIEVEALAETLGSAGGPCFLGAVKTNIGHLEAAAGIAGLIKAALCLRRRFIPPNLHFHTPSPHLELSRTRFVIPAEGRPWPVSNGTPRRAGVSSFGFGGTNAHVVVEEAPAPPAPAAEAEGRPLPLTFSARSAEALRALAAEHAAFLSDPDRGGGLRPVDVAFTTGVRRSHLAHRAAVVGRSLDEWIAALRRFAERPAESSPVEHPPALVFAYSGQGPQWAGMGLGLHRAEPVFRAVLDRAEAEVRRLASWSLLEALAVEERLRRTDVAQPALFALQAALTELLRSWGVEPEAVVGHSAGEVAAAHAAGVLTFEEAVRVAVERGRLMQAAAGRGQMAAVELPLEQAERAIAYLDGRVEVASLNSPTSTVVAGETEAIEALVGRLGEQAVFCKRINLEFAFHSRQMEPFRQPLADALRSIRPQRARLPLVSTLEGRRAAEGDYGPDYWARGIRARVRFAEAVACCVGQGQELFLELGPHPVLSPMIRRCGDAAGRALTSLASLRRNEEDEAKAMLEALCGLYRRGYGVDWSRSLPQEGRVVRLPTYPWQRKRFWIEDRRPASAPPRPAQTASQAEATRLDDLTYTIEWPRRERDPQRGQRGDRPGEWLVLADRGGVGAALAVLLRERGERCLVAYAGRGGSNGQGGRVVDPSSADDVRRLIGQEWKSNGRPRRGIVHLWSLDIPALEPGRSPEAGHGLGCVSALHLARELEEAGGPRLWLVTRGAQAAGTTSSALAVAQAPLWGFGRVLALEQPHCWGGLVDLDPDSPDGEPRRLLEEITQPDGEDQVAFRGEERRVARLARDPLGDGAPVRFSDGTYLVTEGLAGLGLQVARWMAERGARHLVLTSRDGLPERPRSATLPADDGERDRAEAVRGLEAIGASVTVAAADPGDRAAMRSLFDTFGRSLPPLRGVVHGSGPVTTKPVSELEPSAMLEVLRPKVTGAWVLHELTRDLALDFFVLFSSAAAVWGSKGLGHHAAASQFLDALAQQRRALGLPALSVNWGWWSEGGAASVETEAFFRRAGVSDLSSAQALEVLGRLLAEGCVQKTVAAVDWDVFKPAHEARGRRPLLQRMETGGIAIDRQPAAEERDLRDRLKTASRDQRRELLAARVAHDVARLLGFTPGESIDRRQGFFKLGMDSIMSVRLRNSLEASLGRRLPPTVAFEYPTVEALAAYLAGDAAPAAAAAAPPARARASTLPEGLSEDELTALLAEKLKETVPAPRAAKVPPRNQG